MAILLSLGVSRLPLARILDYDTLLTPRQKRFVDILSNIMKKSLCFNAMAHDLQGTHAIF